MQRFHDWPERLVAYLVARERVPFRWGRYANDCYSNAAQWVREATGEDISATLPDWVDAAEADLLLGSIGMVAHLDAHLPRRDSPSFAQRGDVALVETEDGPTLCIVDAEWLVGPGKRRAERLPRSRASIVWAV